MTFTLFHEKMFLQTYKKVNHVSTGGDGPVLIEPLQNQTVVASETAKFLAKVKPGEPRADITWSKNGKQLSPDGKKYKVAYDEQVVLLEIATCESSDAAEYSLVAANKVGKVSSQATLTVHGMSVYLHQALLCEHKEVIHFVLLSNAISDLYIFISQN